MDKKLVAKAVITINASVQNVWEALTKPEIIKQYMFGADVVSDWSVGSSIVWKGEWKGKPYEDKGKILQFDEQRTLQYSHFSPMEGKPDMLENYHTVTITLEGDGKATKVMLMQDNNPTKEYQQHSEKNWQMMLDSLKKLLEK